MGEAAVAGRRRVLPTGSSPLVSAQALGAISWPAKERIFSLVMRLWKDDAIYFPKLGNSQGCVTLLIGFPNVVFRRFFAALGGERLDVVGARPGKSIKR
jgi:hypothetical protein